MRVHHVNCGTMCPFSARLVNGEGSLFARARMVCHCLVVETNDGLALVDTGLGTEEVAHPERRLGASFTRFMGRPRAEETALAHVERLGFRRQDVRHLLPTHMDLDHVGGLSDFPDADVHVFHLEHAAAMNRETRFERERYRPIQWAHGPKWRLHEKLRGEKWNGFDAVEPLAGTNDEVLLIPLHGHTRGHCGVAVKSDRGWLLHAGDAYFFHGEVAVPPTCPWGLSFFQKRVAFDESARVRNQARLRELATTRGAGANDDVHVFSAHCPVEFDQLTAAFTA